MDDVRRRIAAAGGLTPPAPAGASMVEQLVDAKFEDLRRMVRGAGPGQPTQLDATLGLMNEIYTMLLQQQTALKEKTAPQRSEIPQKVQAEAGRVPEPLRSMMTRLSAAGATQVQREVRDNIGQALRSDLWEFCNKATGQRYPFSRSAQQEVTQEDFATLFSSGGKFDEFFQKHLAQAVDTSTRPAWSFRKQGDATVAQFSSALPQFQRAAGIRDAFFRSGGKVPGMTITFNPSEIDTSIKVFTLDVDGQVVRNIHGPPRPATIKWPGSGGTMQVRLSIDPPAASGTSAQTYSGMWALFRAFDGARIESTAQPEKFIVTFNVEGRKASFEVTTSSVVNPFRMREIEQFQCPAGL